METEKENVNEKTAMSVVNCGYGDNNAGWMWSKDFQHGKE